MGALDGRVAVITGAGRGIGREHALLFAAEGAAVVVNDLGGANDGTGADTTPAQEVAAEIRASGGQAVANSASVTSWAEAASLIDQAVSEFGRLDVVVNNAGILRDAFVAGITEEQWDAVIAVHLKGHAAVLHHAAAYWKSCARSGSRVAASVVNTASASGTTMPNPGQVNYGAAKAGIAAMTLVAAQEVAEGEFDAFSPANISPLVAYLATEKCPITGKVFAVQGEAISELAGWHDVKVVETEGPWRIEDIAARLP